MRLLRVVLALEAVPLVQSAASKNSTRGQADSGLLGLQARDPPTGDVHWTFHSSCSMCFLAPMTA